VLFLFALPLIFDQNFVCDQFLWRKLRLLSQVIFSEHCHFGAENVFKDGLLLFLLSMTPASKVKI